MLWVLYSLASAAAYATADAFTKKASSDIDDSILVLSRFFYGSLILFPMLFFVSIPEINSRFWIALAEIIPLEIAAWMIYIKALRNSQLSLIAPILSFTPIFLVATSFILLGELPSLLGFFGIIIVVAGAYILNLKSFGSGIFEPLKSMFREKSSQYMLIVAFLFSITSTLSKVLVQESSSSFTSLSYLLSMSVSFLLVSFFFSRKKILQLKTRFKDLLPIGLFYGIMTLFHNLAITLVIVPYMMSIKRTSSIFSVFYGHFWFREKNMRNRLLGAMIMLLGAVLVILS